jgi:glycerophosphoryl diester phosphodiesterase
MADSDARGLSRRRVLEGVASLSAIGVAGGLMVDQVNAEPAASRPEIVSHRGAAGLAPPNTLMGIRRALEYDIDGIELDVRRSKDGTLLLFHDPLLDWATDRHGRIRDLPWAAIAEARIGGEPIPSLAEALAVLADTDVTLYLEAKRVGYTDAILDLVEAYGLRDRLLLTSPKPAALAPARAAGVPTGLIGIAPNPELLETAADIEATAVSIHFVPSAISWFGEAAREKELQLGYWHLVESERTLAAARNTDPDYITTNRPDIALGVVDD